MYNASPEFHTATMLGGAKTRALIMQGLTVFTGEDILGRSGVVLTERFNSEENITIGACPAATLTTTLINRNGTLSNFNFGSWEVLLGVLTDEETRELDPANVTVVVPQGAAETVFSGHSTAPYFRVNGVAGDSQPSFAVHSIIVLDNAVYMIGSAGEIALASCNNGTWGDELSSTWESVTSATWGDINEVQYILLTPPTLDVFMTARAIEWARINKGVYYEKSSHNLYECYQASGLIEKYEYVPLGKFTVQKPERRRESQIAITAVDYMTKFDVDATSFLNNVTYPLTLGEFYTELCLSVDVAPVTSTFTNSDIVITQQPGLRANITAKEIMRFIAEATGTYSRMTRDGRHELVWFSDISDIVDITTYFSSAVAEYTVRPVSKLRVQSTEKDVGVIVGTGSDVYTILRNPFLIGEDDETIREYVTPIHANLSSIAEYSPITIKTLSDWSIQAGDIVSFTDINSDTYYLPIFIQTIKWNGGTRATIESTGGETRKVISAANGREFNTQKTLHELVVDIDGISSHLTNIDGTVASLEFTTSGLNLAIESGTLTFDGDGLTIMGGGLRIKNNSGSEVLSADIDGDLEFTGKVTADRGKIGGFTIGSNTISAPNIILDSAYGSIETSYGNNTLTLYRSSLYFTEAGNDTAQVDCGSYGVNIYAWAADSEITLDAAGKTLFLAGGTSSSRNKIICGYPATTSSGSADVRWIQLSSGAHNGHYSLAWISSSINTKKNVLDIGDCEEIIDNMRPVTYEPRSEDESGTYYGFIAEEIDECAPLLCSYVNDENGEKAVRSVQYDRVPVLLIKDAQKTHKRLAALEKALEELQNDKN